MKPLPVGSPAPSFTLPDEDGHVFVLNLRRGHPVVLVFYPGDETPVCTKQLCEFRDRWDDLHRRDVRLVAINPQGPDSHKRFREHHRFPFPLLVDHDKRVAKLYKCGGWIVRRTVYVVGPDGAILYARRGKPSVDEILAAVR